MCTDLRQGHTLRNCAPGALRPGACVLTSHQAQLYNASAIVARSRSPTPTLPTPARSNACGMRAAAWASSRAGNRTSSFVGPHDGECSVAFEPRYTPFVLRHGHVTTGLAPSIVQYSQMLDRAQDTPGCICGRFNRWGEHAGIPRTSVRSRAGLDVWWHPLCRQPRSISRIKVTSARWSSAQPTVAHERLRLAGWLVIRTRTTGVPVWRPCPISRNGGSCGRRVG